MRRCTLCCLLAVWLMSGCSPSPETELTVKESNTRKQEHGAGEDSAFTKTDFATLELDDPTAPLEMRDQVASPQSLLNESTIDRTSLGLADEPLFDGPTTNIDQSMGRPPGTTLQLDLQQPENVLTSSPSLVLPDR